MNKSAIVIVQELSIEQIKKLIETYSSLSEVLRSLGVYPNEPRSRSLFLSRVKECNLTWKRPRGGRPTFDQELFVQAVKESSCYSDVLRKLGRGPYGGNINTVKQTIIKLDIDISHFDIKASFARGKNNFLFDKEDLSCLSKITHRSSLRRVILSNKLLPYRCVECNNEGSWRDKPIILQLDHIDGNNTNHLLENLRFLCPNCHSQTDTFGRKNDCYKRVVSLDRVSS